MDEAVADHFIFPFEPFSAFATGTAYDRTVVRPDWAMDMGVRAKQWMLLEAQHQIDGMLLTLEGIELRKVELGILERSNKILPGRSGDNLSLAFREM